MLHFIVILIGILELVSSFNPGTSWRYNGFAALTPDGKVVTWSGTTIKSPTPPSDIKHVEHIFSTKSAYAAVTTEGTVFAWGDDKKGGKVPSGLINVKTITSSEEAFIALHDDGTLTGWGKSPAADVPNGLTGVTAVYATLKSFAAVHNGGHVTIWGEHNSIPLLEGVESVYSTEYHFAFKRFDGTLETTHTFDSTSLANIKTVSTTASAFCALGYNGKVYTFGSSDAAISPVNLENVAQVFSSADAFAALRHDSRIVVWPEKIGDSDIVPPSDEVQQGTKYIASTSYAFSLLRNDDLVFAWGDENYGGKLTTSEGSVKAVYSTEDAFAVIHEDGHVSSWGGDNGGSDITPVDLASADAGVEAIYSTQFAFTALKRDQTVITWSTTTSPSSSIQGPPSDLLGVSKVYGTTEFRSVSDQPHVYACPIGYYGMTFATCAKCPLGKSTTDPESTAESECVPAPDPTPPPSRSPSASPTLSPTVRTCEPGEHIDNRNGRFCEKCQMGKFNPYMNANDCLNCPAGTSSNNIGSSSSTCRPCASGSYSTSGASSCTPCKAGSYSAPESSICTPCAAGTYASIGSSCLMCPSGTYSTYGSSICLKCPIGQFSAPGSSKCDSCSA